MELSALRDEIHNTWMVIRPVLERISDLESSLSKRELERLFNGPLSSAYLCGFEELAAQAIECDWGALGTALESIGDVNPKAAQILSHMQDLQAESQNLQDTISDSDSIDHLAEVSRDIHHKLEATAKVYISFVYNLASHVNYECTMWSLFDQAQAGDEESLFRILRIDKSAVSTSWIAEEFRVRQLNGDWEFFERVGRAISREPILQIGFLSPDIAMMSIFWNEGLSNFPWPKIHALFQEIDLSPGNETFKAFHERMIRAGFKKSRYNRK